MVTDRALSFLYGLHLPDCCEDFQKYYQDYCTIQYCAARTLSLQIDETVYDALAGQFWSMRPPHFMHVRPRPIGSTWDHRYIAFRGQLAESWIADGLLPSEPLFVSSAIGVEGKMDLIMALIRERGRWPRLRAVNVLESLLIEIRQTRAATIIEDAPWFEEAVRSLGQFSHWPIDYDLLARRLGMSAATLRRRFHEATGFSPHHYALSIRIAEAKRLLVDSNLTMSEIAGMLGYRDLFYFSKQFRQLVGTAPSVFRRNFSREHGCT